MRPFQPTATWLLLWCGLLAPEWLSAQTTEKLDIEVQLVVQSLRSDRLKDLARQHAEVLKGKEAGGRAGREAVDFFHDLRARRVLVAVLALEYSAVQPYIYSACFDIFRLEDVVLLYETAAAHAKRPVARLGSEEAYREDLVNRLAEKTARILGVKPKAFRSNSPEDIRAWWIEAIRAGQKVNASPSPLDAALAYFEAKGAPEAPAATSKVEGILWCREQLSFVPELAAGKRVVAGQTRVPLTGVTVHVNGVGTADVYLRAGPLRKLARELNGQPVTVTGELRQVAVISKWFGNDRVGEDVLAPHGKSIWIPSGLANDLPTSRIVVFATGLKLRGPRSKPLLGEPTFKSGDDTFHTFQRLPRSADVTALKIMDFVEAEPKPLTAANFPALLDGLKAIKADDEGAKREARARWYSCRFQTFEGEFLLFLYQGGRAILRAPDGRMGWVEFVHPKRPTPGTGGSRHSRPVAQPVSTATVFHRGATRNAVPQ